MGGYRKYHAHVERLAIGLESIDHRFERIRLDRVNRLAVIAHRDMRLHHFPDFIGNGDAIAIEIH